MPATDRPPTHNRAPNFLLGRVVRAGILRVQDVQAQTPSHGDGVQRAINSLSGVPAPLGLAAVHEVEITVTGQPDSHTGYLLGIQELDAVVRETVLPRLQSAFAAARPADPATILAESHADAQRMLADRAQLHSLRWSPSQFLSIEWRPDMPQSAVLSERFEFAAAHRLHCAELSDAENRRIFGKCNSANGHGHNYRIEVSVRVPVGVKPPRFTLLDLEDVVGRTVIERFDHKHLNLDTQEFRATNPSVENIAAACHELLVEPVRARGGDLVRVTVWETDKTSATFPAP